jgi:ribonuclease R
LQDVSNEDFTEVGLHLSRTERRAALAERQAIDRYMVCYLASKVGAQFAGRVNGVTRFGLFVTLDENGADGLVPISTLPNDFYHHDEQRHRLVGQRHNRVYTLGDRVEIKLAEADPVGGKLVFALLHDGEEAPARPDRHLIGKRKQPSRKPQGIPKRGSSTPRPARHKSAKR